MAGKRVMIVAIASDRGIDTFPRDGVFNSVFGSPVVQITTPPVGDLSSEERTAVEFPLAVLPASATLISVALLLTPQGNPSGNLGLSASETGEIHGYQGDGAITVADMSPATLVGQIVGPTPNGTIAVPIDTPFLQGLLAAGAGHAGLMFKGQDGPTAVLFNFTGVNPLVPAHRRPRLRIRYI
jgi:hypothetical protein